MFTIEEPAYFNKNKVVLRMYVMQYSYDCQLNTVYRQVLGHTWKKSKKPKYRHMAKFLVTNILR